MNNSVLIHIKTHEINETYTYKIRYSASEVSIDLDFSKSSGIMPCIASFGFCSQPLIFNFREMMKETAYT